MLVPKWSRHPDLRGRAKEEGLPKEVRKSSQGGRRIRVSQEVSFWGDTMRESLSLPNALGNLVRPGLSAH